MCAIKDFCVLDASFDGGWATLHHIMANPERVPHHVRIPVKVLDVLNNNIRHDRVPNRAVVRQFCFVGPSLKLMHHSLKLCPLLLTLLERLGLVYVSFCQEAVFVSKILFEAPNFSKELSINPFI